MSHIKTIEIKNFKSIRHQKIEDCRRVNVFIGYPNVGKSNILEALGLYSFLLLKNQQFNFNEICRVKHFSELYFNQDTRETNSVKINNELEVELIIDESNQLNIRINDLLNKSVNGDRKNIFSAIVNGKNFSFSVLNNLRNSEKHEISIPSAVRKYEFKKDILIDAQRPRALSIPYGNNLLDVLQSNPKLRKEIIEIFRLYDLKLNIDRVDESLKFQKELNDGTNITIPYHQISDTLRRLIFYKAAIETNSESFLLFEEPEAHMFPPYIRKFTADVMFDKKNNQYFISTHSPFVIDEFIEEIKDDLSVYVVDYDKGETIIKRLTDDEVIEVAQYGIDLFFNLESYLDKHVQPHSA